MVVVEGVCESNDFGCSSCPCRWDGVAPQLFHLVEEEFGHSNINFSDGCNGENQNLETVRVRFRLYCEYTCIAFGFAPRQEHLPQAPTVYGEWHQGGVSLNRSYF